MEWHLEARPSTPSADWWVWTAVRADQEQFRTGGAVSSGLALEAARAAATQYEQWLEDIASKVVVEEFTPTTT